MNAQRKKKDNARSIDDVLLAPDRNYPRTQDTVPILTTYRESVITRKNTMVMGLEIAIEFDDLDDDATTLGMFDALQRFLRSFIANYQIVVVPRPQMLSPVLEQYRQNERLWQQKRAIIVTLQACLPSLFRWLAVESRRKAHANEELYLSDVDKAMQRLCPCNDLGRGISIADLDLVPGNLAIGVVELGRLHSFFANVHQAIRQHVDLDDIWQQFARRFLPSDAQRLDPYAILDFAIIQKVSASDSVHNAHVLDAGSIAFALQQHLPHADIAGVVARDDTLFHTLLSRFQAGAQMFFEIVDEAAKELAAMCAHSVQAIDNIISLIVIRGKHLESIAQDRTIPVRKVCLILNKHLAPTTRNAVSPSAEQSLEQSYEQLAAQLDKARSHLEAVGVRARPIKAQELIDIIRDVYDKNVAWHIVQSTAHERQKQGQTTAMN